MLQEIKIISTKISVMELQEMSKIFSEQLVKAVVDISQKKMAVGATGYYFRNSKPIN